MQSLVKQNSKLGCMAEEGEFYGWYLLMVLKIMREQENVEDFSGFFFSSSVCIDIFC